MIVEIVTETAIFYYTEYASEPSEEAVDQRLTAAGIGRFRAIAMSTIAAILALMTLALGVRQGSALLQPLAIANRCRVGCSAAAGLDRAARDVEIRPLSHIARRSQASTSSPQPRRPQPFRLPGLSDSRAFVQALFRCPQITVTIFVMLPRLRFRIDFTAAVFS